MRNTISAGLAVGLTLTAGLAMADFTYVDANPRAGGNTTPTSLFAADGVQSVDGLWDVRTGFANDGEIIQSSGTSNLEDVAEITTTLTGLTPGATYHLKVLFWDADSPWSVRAGTTSGSLDLFVPADSFPASGTYSELAGEISAPRADTLTWVADPLFDESNRALFAGDLGVAVADGSGEIAVYIDDVPATATNAVRTWYDGLAYELVETDVVYVDANPRAGGNTTPLASFTADNVQSADGLWDVRTGFANGSNIIQSAGSSTADDVSEITTTLTGLIAGQDYRVYVVFWDADNPWCVRAGYTSANLDLFVPADYFPVGDAEFTGQVSAPSATTLTWVTDPLFTESNRDLFVGDLGLISADSSGEIAVYIDDLPADTNTNWRTWYDGLGVQFIGTSGVNDWQVFAD